LFGGGLAVEALDYGLPSFCSSFLVADGFQYDEGLRWLLSDENWRHRGLQGYLYVNEFHEVKKVIDLHITEYEKMVS